MRLANLGYTMLLGLLFAPSIAFGQFDNVDSAITTIQDWISNLIPLFLGIGFLVFLWGLIQYVTAGADDDKKAKARGLIMYGIIILFVMVAAWGLVGILVNTFGTDSSSGSVSAPTIPGL